MTTTRPATVANLPVQESLHFVKGHGTQNDFVLVLDPDGKLELAPDLVAAVCDRRGGIGADGLIRVVRSGAVAEGAACLEEDAGAHWFMDYRNADGSVAEMCGNGVRVFTAYLEALGLVDAEDLESERGLVVGSRAGVKRVRHALGPDGETDWLAVDMGRWQLVGGERARAAGHDTLVGLPGLDGVPRPGLSFDLGNPHVVVALASEQELTAVDLGDPPRLEPQPPHGANVELIVMEPGVRPSDGAGSLRMRVHERGVGETRSCGTGACAAALAAASWAGPGAPRTWVVEVPGGRLRVQALEGDRVELAGPAALVADGVLDLAALAGRHPVAPTTGS